MTLESLALGVHEQTHELIVFHSDRMHKGSTINLWCQETERMRSTARCQPTTL